MSSDFDHYLLHHGVGTDEKLAMLTDGEFRAHVAGVLALAHKSPMRGYLFVGEIEAQPVHVARKAGVSERVAKSAVTKLRQVGVLVHDAEVGGWYVHNWEQHQAQRRDPTAARRAQDYRDRKRASRGASRDESVSVPDPSRDPSRAPGLPEGIEELEGTSPRPNSAEAEVSPEAQRLCDLLAELMVANDPKAKVAPDSKGWLDAARLLLDRDGRDPAEAEAVLRWCQADAFWRANVLSMPKFREKYTQLLLKRGSVNGASPSHDEVTRRRLESIERLGGLHAQ